KLEKISWKWIMKIKIIQWIHEMKQTTKRMKMARPMIILKR
ncbi:hypothetical protein AWRI1631_50920, partial [Saccharomyces cerevisiae AWRI1631]